MKLGQLFVGGMIGNIGLILMLSFFSQKHQQQKQQCTPARLLRA